MKKHKPIAFLAASDAQHAPPRRFSTLESLTNYWWRFKLTDSGKALVAGGWVAAFIGSASIEVPVYRLLFVLFFIGLAAVFVGGFYRPKLRLTPNTPRRVRAGERVSWNCTMENRSRLPLYDAAVGFFGLPRALGGVAESPAILRLGPGETAEAPLSLHATRRGLYTLPPLRGFTTFPIGLVRSGAPRAESGSLLVLPAFHPLHHVDIPSSTRYQPGGIALTSHVGESPEYIGNREYRPGDSIRKIDFRAWARLARPAVREYQEEYYCRVALVLDTFLRGRGDGLRNALFLAAPSPDDALEAAVSLCAAIADALARGEYLIDLFAAGPELYVFRSGRHITHFESVLEILACVDACKKNPFDALAPALAEELGRISSVVCLFLDWDASRRDLVRAAAEAGCRVKVILVRDAPPTLPLDDAEEWADSVVSIASAAVAQGGIEEL